MSRRRREAGGALRALAGRLAGRAVGVVGDLVADRYLYGEPARLSREAPVIVARYQGEELVPGGAANTAYNLLALQVRAYPVGLIGQDEAGRVLKAQLVSAGAAPAGIIALRGGRTLSKTRVLLGEPHRTRHQTLRLDCEDQGRLPAGTASRLAAALRAADRRVAAWIVSDYGYAVLAEAGLRHLLVEFARRKPVVADSRHRLGEFAGVTAVTPNHQEALEFCGCGAAPADEEGLDALGRRLLARLGLQAALITLGREGMVLYRADAPGRLRLAAVGALDAVDVTGAGDTVAAVFTAALAAGADFAAAARLANYAASVVVMKPRAATLSRAELEAQIAREPPG